MENFVTIATFTYPHEMVIITSRLDAEGIEYFSSDEATVAVYPFISNAIGGIKLNVRERDAEKAIAIIREVRQKEQENITIDSEDGDEKEFIEETEKENKNLGKGCIISLILIGLAIVTGILYSILSK